MDNSHITRALTHASDTAVFESGDGVISRTPELLQEHFTGAAAIIIADENTWKVAGATVHKLFSGRDIMLLEPVIFPGEPMLHADYRHVEEIRDVIRNNDAVPIAVGSGTINDIVKRAAFEAGRRYMVVATAASVDGYASFGASITRNGFKKTMECPAPLAIVADIDVLKSAPPQMTAAGYADLASKITAGADWIIADALSVDPIDPVGWDMVQTDLMTWIGEPKKLRDGDRQAFERLFEGLTMTGFAMQALRKSRPASGCDHLMSHVWEMQHLESDGVPVSHGFKVAIGTLAGTALMEAFFNRDIATLNIDDACSRLPAWADREKQVVAAFGGTPLLTRVLKEAKAKHPSPDALRARLNTLKDDWDAIRSNVMKKRVPFNELKQMFQDAGCPVEPEQINLTRARVKDTFALAQMIRNRYTILDLAYETGWLGDCVSTIVSADGPWPT